MSETYEQRRAREGRQAQLARLASDPVWLAALEARLRHYRQEEPAQ
jgi:hypothetical protein